MAPHPSDQHHGVILISETLWVTGIDYYKKYIISISYTDSEIFYYYDLVH